MKNKEKIAALTVIRDELKTNENFRSSFRKWAARTMLGLYLMTGGSALAETKEAPVETESTDRIVETISKNENFADRIPLLIGALTSVGLLVGGCSWAAYNGELDKATEKQRNWYKRR